jgi:hypothetical protein
MLRNFNFKCNLDEIDKIIEEDVILPLDIQSPLISPDKDKSPAQ